MSGIRKRFETKYTADEMKVFINTKVLPNPAFSVLLSTTNWQNYTLYITSKLGKGTIELKDYIIDIDIELNILGKIAKKALETNIDNEFKQLNK